jgi:hypothetical protein
MFVNNKPKREEEIYIYEDLKKTILFWKLDDNEHQIYNMDALMNLS